MDVWSLAVVVVGIGSSVVLAEDSFEVEVTEAVTTRVTVEVDSSSVKDSTEVSVRSVE